MRVLAVDVGTGTQDVLLFDTEAELENCVQMILPSPTRIVEREVRAATAAGAGVHLTGVTMGGGPCSWALEDHLRRGLPVSATPDAARTLDDDLDRVAALGVQVLGEGSVAPDGYREIVLRDYDHDAIAAALAPFGVTLDVDFLAVAVFDHGAAPSGYSDRAFRFDYLAQTVVQNDLAAFAYLREEIPPRLTRMAAVAATAPAGTPLLVMDTAPAAVLGALDDPRLRAAKTAIVANLGNMHTLAFSLADGRPIALFEHHTGELTRERLEAYLRQLGDGSVTNEAVFADKGHGALVREAPLGQPEIVGIVGPRRRLLAGSALAPHFVVPHGDMMLTGCFGLLRALARKRPDLAPAIDAALDRADT